MGMKAAVRLACCGGFQCSRLTGTEHSGSVQQMFVEHLLHKRHHASPGEYYYQQGTFAVPEKWRRQSPSQLGSICRSVLLSRRFQP
ncbi:uncharacterized protein LOC103796120 [Callithrix jacchus]